MSTKWPLLLVFCRQPIQSQNPGKKGLIFVDKMDAGTTIAQTGLPLGCLQGEWKISRSRGTFATGLEGKTIFFVWRWTKTHSIRGNHHERKGEEIETRLRQAQNQIVFAECVLFEIIILSLRQAEPIKLCSN